MDVNVDNLVVSKLVETKTNSSYVIGIKFDKAIRPLVLIMPEISGYVKTFKVEDKIDKLTSFCIGDEKLLEKYKAIWTKIEDLKNIELDDLPVCNNKQIKTKMRTFGNKIYANFRNLNLPKHDIEYESFTVISIDSLLVCNEKYYLQVFLNNCAYKIVNKQMTDYLENLFDSEVL